jgi:hypothetical protein
MLKTPSMRAGAGAGWNSPPGLKITKAITSTRPTETAARARCRRAARASFWTWAASCAALARLASRKSLSSRLSGSA